MAALDPVLAQRGGVWVSAKQAKDFDTVEVEGPRIDYDLAHVQLKRKTMAGFYDGVSNAVLWPLLHNFPTTIQMSRAPWDEYVAANRAFAEVTLASSKPRDLIWVQDYHLMLVPQMLRARRARASIGWFCHIPWPPASMFGILPFREELIVGLLGADVLGFHTEEYVEHFLECVERYTDFPVDRMRATVKIDKRSVRVIAAPIGIPVQTLTTLAEDSEVNAEAQSIRDKIRGRKILLGVDRLDYTKGIPQRIRAFDRFLQKNKSRANRFVFVQIMVPSRTDVRAYRDLKDEIDRLVGEVNGKHATTGRVPMQYFYRNFDQRSLMAHYRAADVAVVTPLRDGMNLVAQEFCAARTDNDAAIVLSEFAGAAHYMEEALLVNPYDEAELVKAYERALRMSPEEKAERMTSLRQRVLKLDVHRWADSYLELLEYA